MKTPTAKVNHASHEVIYKHLHFSIEKIRRKIEKGAKLSHFMGSTPFFVLKEPENKGRRKIWFLEPSPELFKLQHDFWK